MESAQQATLSKATGTPSAAISNFRVGENNSFDESDSDQSAHSERSLSPSRSGAKKSIAKKRKERKQVGALTDELGTLLGAAFQTPTADSVQHDAPSGMAGQETGNQTMEIDTTSAEKKLSKRTRQNMAKMEKRKLARGWRHQQHGFTADAATAGPQGVPSSEHKLKQKQGKKSTAQERRQRKKETRAKKAASCEDAMEIE